MNPLFGDFHVHIQERPMMSTYRIFLSQRVSDGTVFIKSNGEATRLAEGAKYNEDELYFAEMSSDHLQAFAEALASKGIKTTKDSVAEGKLAATERHLDDMRTIVMSKYQTRVIRDGETNA